MTTTETLSPVSHDLNWYKRVLFEKKIALLTFERVTSLVLVSASNSLPTTI